MTPELQAAFDTAKASWAEHAPTRPDSTDHYLGYTLVWRDENVFVYTPASRLLVAGRLRRETALGVIDAHVETGRLALA